MLTEVACRSVVGDQHDILAEDGVDYRLEVTDSHFPNCIILGVVRVEEEARVLGTSSSGSAHIRAFWTRLSHRGGSGVGS